MKSTVSSCVFLQDVYDKMDYLSSLGKTQTAAVQRDADIGVAEAERDAGIRVRAFFSCSTSSTERHLCSLAAFIKHALWFTLPRKPSARGK